ncbi:TPA: hypothetical protein ACH3X1_006354 [Trebouxia sp. C0004]
MSLLYVAPARQFGRWLSFECILWCLACMVFYMPLSHVLSSGVMLAMTNFTAVPVSRFPGGAKFEIVIAKHCSWPCYGHIFLLIVASLLVRFTSQLVPRRFVQPLIIAYLSVLVLSVAPHLKLSDVATNFEGNKAVPRVSQS